MFVVRRGRKVIKTLGVEEVDMIIAEDKCLTLYSKGQTYVCDGSLAKVCREYPEAFVKIRREVIAKPSTFRGWSGSKAYGVWLHPAEYKCYPTIRASARCATKVTEVFVAVRPTLEESIKIHFGIRS